MATRVRPVSTVTTGEVLWSHDADRPLNLASVQKVLTTAAALRSLGPGFRWRTTVYGEEFDPATGTVDGDLIVRAQMWLGGKTVYNGGGLISEVKPEHRLSERNPTFRGNLVVSEGTASSTAILAQSDGILLQPLPFSLELKKFVVEYYSTGMPKLFASEVLIHDNATGKVVPALSLIHI